jgi:hypothetical protein
MKQNSGARRVHGTTERCAYCSKKFGPDYSPSRKHIHYVFRVRTRFATYYGQVHGSCVTDLRNLQLPDLNNRSQEQYLKQRTAYST